MSISKNQRILITGGTGVLGAYIVNQLLESGYTNIEIFTRSGPKPTLDFIDHPHVEFTVGNVTELYPLTDSIERADYVIHAAAVVSFDPSLFKTMHEVNVGGTANVMNIASTTNVKKVIHVSSIAALSRNETGGKISEESKWINSKYNSYYGITKYLAEQEVWRSYYEGLSMAIVNPSLILGSGDWEQSSLQIFKRAYDGLPFYPKGGTGLVDVRDVSRFIISLMESSIEGERYLLSAGNMSYKEIFTKLCDAMQRKSPQKAVSSWMLDIFWRLEWFRSFITRKSPLITKESVKSTSHQSIYDNSKSLTFEDFKYRDLNDSISEFGKKYAEYRSQN
ncbi:MAG: NAD-dependent epimerase/dehydratase family protein [Saprospiraceae bacterium]|nr:NAD-dependent epimerase/dehydratase family protein [Saprospiraceae bacterium]